jgi:hypothetical protein
VKTSLACAAALSIAAGAPFSASAATLTIHVPSTATTFVKGALVTGHLTPAAANKRIKLRASIGGRQQTLAIAKTNASGVFKVQLRARKPLWITAKWGPAVSARARLLVRPRVRLGGSSAMGFGSVKVQGTVAPARLGRKIDVVVRRGGRVIAHRSVTLSHGKRFSLAVPARGTGRYLVRVRYAGDARFGSAGTAKLLRAMLPDLSVGSSGPAVAALRRQLLDLGYHQATAGASYGYDLLDAVIAFQKVEGLSRTGTVTADVWRALATAQRPKPRYPSQGDHLEVDKGHQVLLIVRGGQTQWVLPVSSGGYGRYTPEGTFSIIRKVTGMDPSPLGVLYDPMYFVGGYAIHGSPSVPSYPASHGCVRVPMWAASWLFGFNDIGEVVDSYS